MSNFVQLPLLLATAIALVPPGIFHGHEVVARDGETWLALHVSGGDAALVATKLALRPVVDTLHDGPGEQTGVEVASADGAGVLMYLRGASLRAGPIELARVSAADDPLSQSEPHRFTFRGRAYRIETQCEPAPTLSVDGQGQYACSVLLQSPAGRQVLTERVGYFEPGSDVMSFADDGVQQLLFAGDLDRDGELDVIFDTSHHYNVRRPTMFLSTQATEGNLVGEVAYHQSAGC